MLIFRLGVSNGLDTGPRREIAALTSHAKLQIAMATFRGQTCQKSKIANVIRHP